VKAGLNGLVGRVIFVWVLYFEDDEACPTTSNKLYNISSIQTRFAVAESTIVGVEYVEVVNIMCYRSQWLHTYYVQLLEELHSVIS
jgi:hypothetical protein